MMWKTFFCTATAFLFLGCVPSIHPLHTEQDLVWEPALEGDWVESDGSLWSFRLVEGEPAYSLTQISDGVPSRFVVHLLRLNGTLFWDLQPDETAPDNGLYRFHLQPLHSFGKLEFEGGRLRAGSLDERWLEKALRNRQVEIECLRVDDRLILTAPTPRLREFVLRWADDPEAFGRTIVLYKTR